MLCMQQTSIQFQTLHRIAWALFRSSILKHRASSDPWVLLCVDQAPSTPQKLWKWSAIWCFSAPKYCGIIEGRSQTKQGGDPRVNPRTFLEPRRNSEDHPPRGTWLTLLNGPLSLQNHNAHTVPHYLLISTGQHLLAVWEFKSHPWHCPMMLMTLWLTTAEGLNQPRVHPGMKGREWAWAHSYWAPKNEEILVPHSRDKPRYM